MKEFIWVTSQINETGNGQILVWNGFMVVDPYLRGRCPHQWLYLGDLVEIFRVRLKSRIPTW